jgi:hypothetical protein
MPSTTAARKQRPCQEVIPGLVGLPAVRERVQYNLRHQEVAQLLVVIEMLASLKASALVGANQPPSGPRVALGAIPRIKLRSVPVFQPSVHR